ncbi:photosystem I reaction center protein subunit XI [Nodularia spumigena CS-584]|jgi:photosystem I subunit XI|uniref:Photosystem I reaction center subunit XI n=2 Tax=Nodularia spumigena TaxID=70799 RepID=A0A166ID32_NODSP|nr:MULTISPECIES: photosystem I reaction center protein subunit XI [Cyanophyceae]MDB9355671.1 photosystem I reaction center protein subunit XI [Nodularia spumigena CS-587/03]AHJ30306.1 photosystem I subunit XI (PsaL) [Nodularia spumigena CCY9414]EAW46654.1 photosystem I reaction center protein subunit XI [Nodularia spumigena CCY9414]KZL48232.1 photosystem I reaction center protein subunit XI [Nodularia spumigena CENA596]MDB9304743.1 photosystem I reaction center protein subunit XI [Nodularia sp
MAQAVNSAKNRPSDPRNREVVAPAGRDPQQGNLETPINSSPLVKWFINNLPAYRQGLNPSRRGLEVGMAHGYLLFGPFAKLGPLRNATNANLAGLLGAIGLVVILTACLSLYANSNPSKALASVTVPNPPVDAFNSKESWNNFASSFLIGGIGGAVVAYFLTSNLGVIQALFG